MCCFRSAALELGFAQHHYDENNVTLMIGNAILSCEVPYRHWSRPPKILSPMGHHPLGLLPVFLSSCVIFGTGGGVFARPRAHCWTGGSFVMSAFGDRCCRGGLCEQG